MTSPNLFCFATKELSQDAIVCWLIEWAGAETKGSPAKEALRRCGRAFVDALFAKWQDWEIELGERICTEVRRQEHNIDVLARVDGRHVLLIEDKTDTGVHDEQLERYRTLVLEGGTKFKEVEEDDLFPIYFKTGNHSLRDRQHAEDEGYVVFDRADFMRVLDTYKGTNAILVDFRRHLKWWQRETESFHGWTRDGEKNSRGWEGFYRWIEESTLVGRDDDWGSLTTRVGSYWGIWIEPPEMSRNSKFAIWIEEDTISFRLYGALRRVSAEGMDREKQYWANALVERGDGRLRRPRRLAATTTKPMSVAEWRGWLAFCASGRFDMEGTLENLTEARKMLLSAIRGGRR